MPCEIAWEIEEQLDSWQKTRTHNYSHFRGFFGSIFSVPFHLSLSFHSVSSKDVFNMCTCGGAEGVHSLPVSFVVVDVVVIDYIVK